MKQGCTAGNVNAIISKWIFLIVLGSAPFWASAQHSITPMEKGEYVTIREPDYKDPKIEMGGYFRAYSNSKRETYTYGSSISGKIAQEIGLRFRSTFNTNVSVNALVTNKDYVVKDQEAGYETQNDDEGYNREDGMDAIFEEAFVEYNHNPHAIFRVGRQPVSVGAGKGLIFDGNLNAISQSCRMGTWCTYIGGARLGTSDTLYWAQLDYPVYMDDIMLDDLWGKPGAKRQQNSLNVKVFRMLYNGHDTPLANFGGTTSTESDYHQKDSSDRYVYFDNDRVEYFGLGVTWHHYDWMVDFVYTAMQGDRDYHVGSEEDSTSHEELGSRSVSGLAFQLDTSYLITPNWKAEGTYFYSTGDDPLETDENTWDRDSKAYYEIQKGEYGKALIYFNGIDRMGEGHSVSNLIYQNLGISYRDDAHWFGWDLQYFNFNRNKPVLDQGGNEEKEIGQELDMIFSFHLETQLQVQLFWAGFRRGGAYSANDNVAPDDDDQEFSLFGINCRYDF